MELVLRHFGGIDGKDRSLVALRHEVLLGLGEIRWYRVYYVLIKGRFFVY